MTGIKKNANIPTVIEDDLLQTGNKYKYVILFSDTLKKNNLFSGKRFLKQH